MITVLKDLRWCGIPSWFLSIFCLIKYLLRPYENHCDKTNTLQNSCLYDFQMPRKYFP